MKDATDITLILDRSGSMQSIREATIAGVNQFLKEQQKNVDDEATVTQVQFDNEYHVVYSDIPVKNAPELTVDTFVPRGATALLDAIGRTIDTLGKRLGNLLEDQRPSRVVVVIVTDGFENSSTDYDKAKINAMITHQQTVYNWTFVFLAANQDAIASGASLGIRSAFSATYNATGAGAQAMYSTVSSKVNLMRSVKDSAVMGFDDSDRDTLTNAK